MSGIYITRYATTTREVRSYSHVDTEVVEGIQGVIDYLLPMVSDRNREVATDRLDIFKKPRLCKKCMEHAPQPMVFDIANTNCECLCKIKKTPCGVHGE